MGTRRISSFEVGQTFESPFEEDKLHTFAMEYRDGELKHNFTVKRVIPTYKDSKVGGCFVVRGDDNIRESFKKSKDISECLGEQIYPKLRNIKRIYSSKMHPLGENQQVEGDSPQSLHQMLIHTLVSKYKNHESGSIEITLRNRLDSINELLISEMEKTGISEVGKPSIFLMFGEIIRSKDTIDLEITIIGYFGTNIYTVDYNIKTPTKEFEHKYNGSMKLNDTIGQIIDFSTSAVETISYESPYASNKISKFLRDEQRIKWFVSQVMKSSMDELLEKF